MEAGTQTPPAALDPQGDLPGEQDGEQGRTIEEVVVEGRGQQLTLDVGGLPPDCATVKLQGGSIGIPRGQYDKGDTLALLVKVRCDAVAVIDKRDPKTAEVTETERRHLFKVTSVERLKG
jgi:hypothetical protein